MDLSNFIQDFLRVSYFMKAQEDERVARMSFWQPWVDKDDGPKDCSNKHLPTTKWRRERRNNRLPEYSRQEQQRNGESSGDLGSPEPDGFSTRGGSTTGAAVKETPLDMSVRQRGLPPSYAQTMNNPGYRTNYRQPPPPPPPPASKEEIPAGVNPFNGISMCDPIIDEHFRRSLGENYQSLLMNNNISKDGKNSPPRRARTSDIEDLMDSSGMSVDDHFAKALGETWVKLNKNKREIKNTSDNQNVVSI